MTEDPLHAAIRQVGTLPPCDQPAALRAALEAEGRFDAATVDQVVSAHTAACDGLQAATRTVADLTPAQADEVNAALHEFAQEAARTEEQDIRRIIADQIGDATPTDIQIKEAKAELLELRHRGIVDLRNTLIANIQTKGA
ncbi:MAG: hypothetical protein ABJM82_16920 [Shimia thalassica]|uniref:hypothetical protein n=1 Tax=Shimia thalassica TaxID=1715693 RepID=UPI003297AF4D